MPTPCARLEWAWEQASWGWVRGVQITKAAAPKPRAPRRAWRAQARALRRKPDMATYRREFRPLNACCHGQRSSRPPTDGSQPRTDRRTRPARTAHLRARRDHEPPTLVGYGVPTAGGHVPRGGGDRRARRAARLLPRPRRMPGLALGLAGRAAGHADGADRLPWRPYPDRQDHRPRQARDADHEGAGPGFRRRRHGGK